MASALASVSVDVRIASICFGNSLTMQSGSQKLSEYVAASAGQSTKCQGLNTGSDRCRRSLCGNPPGDQAFRLTRVDGEPSTRSSYPTRGMEGGDRRV
jgi:hypothetical protein